MRKSSIVTLCVALLLVAIIGVVMASITNSSASRAIADSSSTSATKLANGPAPVPPANSARPEWLKSIGARAVSVDEAGRAVPKARKLPEAVAAGRRSGVYLLQRGPKEATAEARGSHGNEAVIADYGNVSVVEYAAPVGTDAAEYAHAKDETTEKDTLQYANVNGIPAYGWSKGSYDVRDKGQSITVEHDASTIKWLQDEVVFSVTSSEKSFDDLVLIAEEVSRAAK